MAAWLVCNWQHFAVKTYVVHFYLGVCKPPPKSAILEVQSLYGLSWLFAEPEFRYFTSSQIHVPNGWVFAFCTDEKFLVIRSHLACSTFMK